MKKIIAVLVFLVGSLFSTLCEGQSFSSAIFDSLSLGMTSPGSYVLALTMKDSTATSHLFAGGHFKIAGRKTAVNIAEWRDTDSYDPTRGKWEPLGTGTDSDVCAAAMYHQYLYAGGKFDTAGGIACSHIARWDTAALKWDSLIGKLNGHVYALCVYNNNLYVGGNFTIADGDTVNRIAVWKDSVWAAVGRGFDTGTVYALTVSNDTLYAGGSFLKSNGVVVNHIAKLSGASWDSMKGGTNNTVYALADYNNSLYVGGAFTKSDNIPTSYISIYHNYFGHAWSDLAPGVNDTVRALNAGTGMPGMVVKKTGQGIGGGNILLIGGNFDSVGGYSSHYIAGWGYGGWDTVGELNGPVYALANPYEKFNGQNYVGGEFSIANNASLSQTMTVNNIAYLWIGLGGGILIISNKSMVNVFPNPSNGVFTMQLSVDGRRLSVEVYNVLGEKVYSNYQITKSSNYQIDLSTNPSGIYLFRVVVENGELLGEGKLIINK